jgi:ComF family protein
MIWYNRIFAWFSDLLFLVYPEQCEACGNSLVRGESVLCIKCLADMPRTDYMHWDDNPVIQVFWGRVRVEMATALFLFGKGSRYRKLLHKLKYKRKPEIGVFLGKELGASLNQSKYFTKIDAIVPVPLHKSRLKTRGYNQSLMIALGISEVTGWDVYTDLLLRVHATETQTKKNKEERWKNVSGKFAVENSERVKNKSVLLVDDVVTTGATLEACAEELLKIEGLKLYIAVLARA